MGRVALATLVLTALLTTRAAHAVEPPAYVLIANATVKLTSVSKGDVRAIFAKKMTRWLDDAGITPFDLTVGDQTRVAFSSAVLGKSPQAILSEWRQRIFTGQGTPPRELKDDASMIAAVAATPGAIGYVHSAIALPPQVHVVVVVE